MFANVWHHAEDDLLDTSFDLTDKGRIRVEIVLSGISRFGDSEHRRIHEKG